VLLSLLFIAGVDVLWCSDGVMIVLWCLLMVDYLKYCLCLILWSVGFRLLCSFWYFRSAGVLMMVFPNLYYFISFVVLVCISACGCKGCARCIAYLCLFICEVYFCINCM